MPVSRQTKREADDEIRKLIARLRDPLPGSALKDVYPDMLQAADTLEDLWRVALAGNDLLRDLDGLIPDSEGDGSDDEELPTAADVRGILS